MEQSIEVRTKEANLQLREALDKILIKEDNTLIEADRLFLKARRVYLTGADIARYPSVFEVEEIAEDSYFPDKKYSEIQNMAKDLGLEKVVGKTRAELEEYILTHTDN